MAHFYIVCIHSHSSGLFILTFIDFIRIDQYADEVASGSVDIQLK